MSEKNILNKSIDKAFYGGISGFTAMGAQVTTLMWLRTTMNYQYRYGGNFTGTLTKLYNQGGIFRFYKGYPVAMMMGPISRFSDTASNTFAMTYLEQYNLSTTSKTILGSGIASINRIFLMPLDTLKTSLQVNSNSGIKDIRNKIKTNGIRTLYNGSLAAVSATFVGHYPWFLTYNLLNENLPKTEDNKIKFLRNGFIGFSSALVSDISSNSLRVIKTNKQTFNTDKSYRYVVKDIIKNDGILGLFGRGLKTRILTNGIQGFFFVVIWKYIEEQLK